MLFAEVESGGWRDFVMFAGPVVSGVAVWMLTEWRKGRAQARTEQQEDMRFLLTEKDKLLERYKNEAADREKEHREELGQRDAQHRDELRRREAQLTETVEREMALARRVGALELKYGRMEVYVERLEEIAEEWAALTNKKFRRWRDTPLASPPSPTPPPAPVKSNGSSHNLPRPTPPPDPDSGPENKL